MAQLHLIERDRADTDSDDDLMTDFLAHFAGRAMLTRREVREFLGISGQGLERWEKDGGGPPVFKHRRTVRYPTRAFCRWLASQCR